MRRSLRAPLLVASAVAALLVALLVGCGGQAAAPSPAAAPPVSEAAPPGVPAQPAAQPESEKPEEKGPAAQGQPPAPVSPPAAEEQAPRLQLAIEVPDLVMALPPVGILGMVPQMAQRGGFFENASLRVRFAEVASSQAALEALQGGSVHLAVLTLPDASKGASAPVPVKVLGAVLGSQPYNVVVADGVARQRGLRSTSTLAERLAMLKGLRLGVPDDPLARGTTSTLVREAGLSEGDVKLVFLAAERLLASLQAGEVDGLVAAHPVLERAIVEQGAGLLVNLSRGEVTALEPFPWLVVATTTAFQRRAPDTLIAVVLGIWNAQRQIRQDPVRSQDLLAEVFGGLGAEVYRESARIYFPAAPNNPLLTPLSYSKVFRVLGETPTPYLQVVDNRYTEALIPRR